MLVIRERPGKAVFLFCYPQSAIGIRLYTVYSGGMQGYITTDEAKDALRKADAKANSYYQQYKQEIIAHEETKKQARNTRFKLLLELKVRDEIIDLLNEQIGQLLRRDRKQRQPDEG